MLNFLEDIAFKQAVISKTFPDLENINMCAILYKFPNRKLETLVHNWKEEALHFEYPSKFHYLAKALKVRNNKNLGTQPSYLNLISYLKRFQYQKSCANLKPKNFS